MAWVLIDLISQQSMIEINLKIGWCCLTHLYKKSQLYSSASLQALLRVQCLFYSWWGRSIVRIFLRRGRLANRWNNVLFFPPRLANLDSPAAAGCISRVVSRWVVWFDGLWVQRCFAGASLIVTDPDWGCSIYRIRWILQEQQICLLWQNSFVYFWVGVGCSQTKSCA